MHRAATDRENVIQVLREARERFGAATRGLPDEAVDGAAAPGPPAETAAMRAELEKALRWMVEIEPTLGDEVEDLEAGDEYFSQDPVVSLVQTAIDAAASGVPPTAGVAVPGLAGAGLAASTAAGKKAGPPDVLSSVGDALKYLFLPRAPFVEHKSLQDFRFTMPERCTVALVADWGTGFPGAVDVLKRIADEKPDHMVHLGDVYSSGTPEEVRKHFIGLIQEHGPPECRFWALNGNHEMVSKGYGYFQHVLPFCGQPASYFSLGNKHWRLVGLDTAYEGYRLHPPQLDWAAHLLAEPPGPRNILMTHHQVFSPIDPRPAENATGVHLGPLAEPGNVFAWFWGHEHRCLLYEPDPGRGGMRARCIGHGGKKMKLPAFPGPKPDLPAPPVLRAWELSRPEEPDMAMNGFALLRFDGPRLDVRYVAEDGQTFFDETWNASDP